MPVHYALRVQFGPHIDAATGAAELLEACRGARPDEVLLFLAAEELNNGHETLDELLEWLAVLRPYRDALVREGLEVSLNPWITVLHCDRSRRRKPGQDWQTMVDWQGRAAEAVVCPLDAGWRTYYREALRLFAAEGYRVIWVEDDVRLANHEPLDWGGCFCPLHVAEFNRRAGVAATREEIIAAVLQPGVPHPWRDLWLDMWDETQTAMVAEWREVVEAGGSRLGLMSSGLEAHSVEGRHWDRWWQALAGDQPPIHRPHFTGYNDMPGWNWPGSIAMLDLNRNIEPAGAEIGPEIENYPYGWAKSLRQTAAAIVQAVIQGADRLNISLYDFMGNLPSDDRTRESFLAGWQPALNWLSERFPPTLKSHGIGIPWHEDASRRVHTAAGQDWRELLVRVMGWPAWLGGFGHPFQMRTSPALNALAGDMAWVPDEDELRELLRRGLLLDGPAAAVLVERGLGDWIGLQDARFISQADVLYSMEETTDPRFTLRNGALVTLNDRPPAARLLQGRLLPGARSVSRVLDPKGREVGHGVVVYENARGGRVAVCPWNANASPDGAGGQRNLQRAAQINGLVSWLSREQLLGRAWGSPWLVSQFFSDGERWRGVVWNASPDATLTIQLELPGRMTLREAVHLDATGVPRPAVWDGAALHLAQPLHQWECVVLTD